MRQRIRVQRAPGPGVARGARIAARMPIARSSAASASPAKRLEVEFTTIPVTNTPGFARDPDTARRIQQASQSGRPIEPMARAQLEQRFGVDLGAIRVHTDGAADTLSHELHANAFTTGSEIFFRSGAYEPASHAGLKLLAHEVVHTLQQASGPVNGVPAPGGVVVSEPGDNYERAAEATAEAVTGDRAPPTVATPAAAGPSIGASSYVQRDVLDEIAKYAGLGGGVVGAGLTAAGGTAAAAAPWVTGPIAAGLLGAYGGKALNEHTSVGGHTQEVLGGFDAMMTDPGERSWMLRQSESFDENWDKGNYGSALASGAKLAGGGLLGALGGIGGGLVDAGEWIGKELF